MSLVNCREMTWRALEEGYAVPQFNINGLEWCKTVLEVCQQEVSPVILGTAMAAVKSLGGYRTVVGMVHGLLEDLNITVPVALHLDHGSYEACLLCLKAGYSSVMFDGSKLPFEENLMKTRELAERCRQQDVSLEAEVGAIGRTETGTGECADPLECARIAQEGITMLAAGIGNIHGVYPPNWKGLAWKTLEEIGDKVDGIPLVLHGGSGIPEDMITKAISMGVGKININTECQIAYMAGARAYFEQEMDRKEKGYFARNLTTAALEHIQPILKEKIALFGCGGKGVTAK